MSDNHDPFMPEDDSTLSTETPTMPATNEAYKVRSTFDTMPGVSTRPVAADGVDLKLKQKELGTQATTDNMHSLDEAALLKIESEIPEVVNLVNEAVQNLSLKGVSPEKLAQIKSMVLSSNFQKPDRRIIDIAVNAALFSIDNPKDIKTQPSRLQAKMSTSQKLKNRIMNFLGLKK